MNTMLVINDQYNENYFAIALDKDYLFLCELDLCWAKLFLVLKYRLKTLQ